MNVKSNMKEILQYLSDLDQNNNSEWFHANKPRYDRARNTYLVVVQKVIDLLQFDDPRLSGLEAKDAMFRIFRDIRFSKDKTPYKTHFGAYMARGGRKSREAGYYLHIGNDEMFLAAGVHSPEKADLHAVRQEILYQPDTFGSLLETKRTQGYSTSERDKLVKGPMGFPKDSPHIEYLKYKHYLLSHPLAEQELFAENAPAVIAGHFRELVPFTEFINTALEFKGNE
ncbi:MAG: DUF2461 domain-containing protein [Bacteroidales bacterium]|nr:DUF2461 domain-containing protein [Bacteroidales bacterium]